MTQLEYPLSSSRFPTRRAAAFSQTEPPRDKSARVVSGVRSLRCTVGSMELRNLYGHVLKSDSFYYENESKIPLRKQFSLFSKRSTP